MYHGDETWTVLKSGKQKIKPVCIQYKGGVNLKDKLLQSYLAERNE
jgi:hypothetical protein